MNLFGRNDGKTEHLWTEERLSAYLDDELSRKDRTAVEHHLARCQECQWNLRTMRQTVQWTRELPTVPVPRVFTIPAPAQPVRARPRRWGVALLQGATALAALLLVFAVAGDLVLTSVMPASQPEIQLMKEEVVVDVGATEAEEMVVTAQMEMQSAAPAAAPTKTVGPAPVEETSPTPAPEATVAAQAAPIEPSPMPSPTPSPEVGGMGAVGFGTPAEEATERSAADQTTETTELPTEAVRAGVGGGQETEAPAGEAPNMLTTEAYPAPDTAEPESGPMPALPPEPPAEQEPTIVAREQEPARLAPEDGLQARGEVQEREPLLAWIQLAELVLGVAFVLLATITLVVMIQRRRTR